MSLESDAAFAGSSSRNGDGPGTRRRSLPRARLTARSSRKSDGYATGLVVYALRRSGRPVSRPAVQKGQQWLVDHQVPERIGDPA